MERERRHFISKVATTGKDNIRPGDSDVNLLKTANELRGDIPTGDGEVG